MNRVIVVAIAVGLLGLHVAHNAFLSQLHLPSGSNPSAWQNRHYYYLGVMFAQPTILAAWTWYGGVIFVHDSFVDCDGRILFGYLADLADELKSDDDE